MNAAETLLATGAPNAVAIVCGEEQVSYSQLRARVRRAAGAWHALGLEPGERVFVLGPDSIDWVVAYLGAIWAGGVAVGVNPRLPLAELAPVVAESEPRFLWCEEVPGTDLATTIVLASVWAHDLANAQGMAAVERADDDPALWIGTSGTTGQPKGVVHAQRTVKFAHAFAHGVLGIAPSDRLYATSKLFFAYALGNALFAALRSGATVILDRVWPTPERVEAMVLQHKPTLVFSVPTLYLKMLQAGVAPRLARRGIRHFVSAGESLPAATRSAWRDATGLAPISGYGTTETLCLMLYSARDDGLLAPTPLTQVQPTSSGDSDRPQRLWIRSPMVALGYWQRAQAQAESFQGGAFSPGDLFLRQGDGRYEYAGRDDDLLKIAGQWVSTLWVEQSLLAACGETLLQVGSVGVTTDAGLAALSVLAVAAPGCREQAAQRVTQAIDAMPRHRQPRWVHWVDALPLTATGKLQRSRLRALHTAALMNAELQAPSQPYQV